VPSASTRRITLCVAATIFAIELAGNWYETQVPLTLREHVGSATLVGMIMGVDNLAALLLQPWAGRRSDGTRTAWGRRAPYLVVGLPLLACLLGLIPWAGTLALLLPVLVGYAVVVNVLRPVAESLIPDFLDARQQGWANGLARTAGGASAMCALGIGLLLVDDHPRIAFALPAALLVAAAALVSWGLRDAGSPGYRNASAGGHGDQVARVCSLLRSIAIDPDRTRVLLLLAAALTSATWGAARSLSTTYVVEIGDVSRGEAGALLLPGALVFLVSAVPSAWCAERFGRIAVMAAGLAVVVVSFTGAAVVGTPAALAVANAVAALGFAAFAVNAVVMFWHLAPGAHVIGVYTGIFAMTNGFGGLVGPAVAGALVDLTAWRLFPLYVAAFAAGALVVMRRLGSRVPAG
jgi:MFS family permease